MINKSDAILLLTELQGNGIDCSEPLKSLIKGDISLDTLKFINAHRPMDLTNFYEKVRTSHNNKRSTLYTNIVREKVDDPKEVLTTLASLQLQIYLYCKNVEDTRMFLRGARADEISKALLNYFNTGDLIPCNKLIHLFKCDIKALEFSIGRE